MEWIFDDVAEHGEGPLWDPVTNKLYWVDIMAGAYFIGDPVTLETKRYTVGQPIGVIALREQGGLVMALRDGIALQDKGSSRFHFIARPEQRSHMRFNDGGVDPAGRFYAGTMSLEGNDPVGNLYSMEANTILKQHEHSLYIPNGMAWSTQGDLFYFTDTNRHVIYSYDYDVAKGEMFNKRNFITFSENEFPDGLTTDEDGNLWICMWGDSKVVCYDDKGKLVVDLKVPVPHPTSCCFGGAQRKTLFITTSRQPLSLHDKQQFPMAGRMLRMETPVTGRMPFYYKG